MKKLIALLLALVMMIGMVACGAKEEAAAPAATEAAPAATEAVGEAAAEAEEVTLTYWLPCNDLEDGAAEQKGIVNAAKAFMAKYPNIKLDLDPIGGNSDD